MARSVAMRLISILVLSATAAAAQSPPPARIGGAATSGSEVEPSLVLSAALAPRRQELSATVARALSRVRAFARSHGWERLDTASFIDRVVIFDRKADFDHALLTAAGEDPATPLPATYCAAVENRGLMAVSPELYAQAYPEGVEEASYEKLLAHEIAHQLHVRILGGDEEAMGPIWFFEGFAIFAADQLRSAPIELSPQEIWGVVGDPERGSYVKYGYVFRHFAAKAPLPLLVEKAGRADFVEWLRTLE